MQTKEKNYKPLPNLEVKLNMCNNFKYTTLSKMNMAHQAIMRITIYNAKSIQEAKEIKDSILATSYTMTATDESLM